MEKSSAKKPDRCRCRAAQHPEPYQKADRAPFALERRRKFRNLMGTYLYWFNFKYAGVVLRTADSSAALRLRSRGRRNGTWPASPRPWYAAREIGFHAARWPTACSWRPTPRGSRSGSLAMRPKPLPASIGSRHAQAMIETGPGSSTVGPNRAACAGSCKGPSSSWRIGSHCWRAPWSSLYSGSTLRFPGSDQP